MSLFPQFPAHQFELGIGEVAIWVVLDEVKELKVLACLNNV